MPKALLDLYRYERARVALYAYDPKVFRSNALQILANAGRCEQAGGGRRLQWRRVSHSPCGAQAAWLLHHLHGAHARGGGALRRSSHNPPLAPHLRSARASSLSPPRRGAVLTESR